MFNLLTSGAGYAIIVVNLLCTSYYSLIVTYPLLFIKKSFGEVLPWENCDNPWNTESCIKVRLHDKRTSNRMCDINALQRRFHIIHDLYFVFTLQLAGRDTINATISENMTVSTPSDEFFQWVTIFFFYINSKNIFGYKTKLI